MPGFNGMGPWGRGLRRDRNWRDCDWGGEYEFPGYGPAMWWDIPAARSYATQREELADLRCRAQMLTQELETVQKRIAELAQKWTEPWTVNRRLIFHAGPPLSALALKLQSWGQSESHRGTAGEAPTPLGYGFPASESQGFLETITAFSPCKASLS